MIKKFRDLFALILACVIFPVIWILAGLNIISLPGEVVGATIAIESLIAQFYFRKKAEGETV